MFAVGGVTYKILDNNKMATMPDYNCKLSEITEQCRSVHYNQQPNAKQKLQFLEKLLMN